MRIISAKNNIGSKYSPRGLNITFIIGETDPYLSLGTHLKLTEEGKDHYFEVATASTVEIESRRCLECTATETGNSRTRFKEDFDPRKVINRTIEVVTDPELINKIRQEAHYC
jgi:hypothetical protein